MSDIFVSYASEDRPRVKVLSQALEAQGWSVWWDRSIPFGKRFHQVIEQELAAARSVMVIWSEHSVGSDWVRAEAGEGMNRGVLVPVAIDDVRPPLVFRQVQTADLAGWQGDQESPVFRKLMADLESLLGAPPDPNVAPLPREAEPPVARPDPEPRPEPPARRGGTVPPWPWLVAGALGTALVALLLWLWLTPGEPEVVGPIPKDDEQGEVDDGPEESDGIVEDDVPDDIPGGQDGGEEADPREREDPEEVVQPPPPPPPPPPSLPPPEIAAFVARPPEIDSGGEAKLLWRTENAREVVIDGLGTFPASGETSVRPQATSTYHLMARSGDGRTVSGTVEVTVRVPPEDAGFTGSVLLREGEPADLDTGRTGPGLAATADLLLTASSDNDRIPVTPMNGTLYRVVRDRSDCPTADLSASRFSLSRLRVDSYLCVRTSERRLATCRVAEVDTRSSTATLHLRCITE